MNASENERTRLLPHRQRTPLLAFVGTERAPSNDDEHDAIRERGFWRAFDRDPRAFTRLPNGYKRTNMNGC